MATNNSMEAPLLGASVITADGYELGKLKEVRGTSFRIDAPWHRDYWLEADYIESMAGFTVLLRMAKDKVAALKTNRPE